MPQIAQQESVLSGRGKVQKLVVENNFPDSFFSYLLTELNGIGATTAGSLWDAGYLTKEQVLNAPDEELIQIKGIGKKLVEKIKSKK
jgi:ERCC4-type nuclease